MMYPSITALMVRLCPPIQDFNLNLDFNSDDIAFDDELDGLLIHDHKKLSRLGKDSIDAVKSPRNKRIFENLESDYISIFTINIAGDVAEFRSMCKEFGFGLYKVWLLDKVKIPLNILLAKPEDVYSLIHNLLAFRTAIACTICKLLYGTNDAIEAMSTISTSSAMSIDSSIPTVASPLHYSSSSKKLKKRKSKKNM
ncbi:hypothetical protein C2G38_2255123 [Gigaspora rosea]|uniref:Uncharacterized protein n=1 Tax=Gigaspora rosea TaxID=44941 RepID=A0A397TYX7_9GLOM|nr:hypothetical protein C2G38_2255123 [Gigaspora rosea]